MVMAVGWFCVVGGPMGDSGDGRGGCCVVWWSYMGDSGCGGVNDEDDYYGVDDAIACQTLS